MEEVSASSSGSIIGLHLCLGKTIDEIVEIFFNTDTSPMSKLDLNVFLKSFGFVGTSYIREQVISTCEGKDLTFRDLPKKFHVSALCVSSGLTEYFSRDTHPDMSVGEAIQMSCSIPILMASHEFQGKLYCDGGCLETVAGYPFLGKLQKDVFVIELKNTFRQNKIENFKEYIQALVNSYFCTSRLVYNFPCVKIDASAFDVVDMSMSIEDKMRLFILGNKFPCVLQQDEPAVWSKNEYKGDESGGDYEIGPPGKFCQQQDQTGIVREDLCVLGHQSPIAPDEQNEGR